MLGIIINSSCSQKLLYKLNIIPEHELIYTAGINTFTVFSQVIAHEEMGIFCKLLTIILFLGSSLPFHHFYGVRVVFCTVSKFNSSTRSYCAEVQCQIGNLSSLSVLKKETVLSALLLSSSIFIDPIITEFCCVPLLKTS